jgi:hypothetical protein
MSEIKMIDLSGISSEPVCTTIDHLLDKVSQALGWVAQPMQLVRIAKAEAVADKIKALQMLKSPKFNTGD